ncbi:MAG TPA: GAF domain-containing protein [Chitinophagaceae bacterium]|nr:GAF domain-containing protein [Chitinophagaceae bacterium]
MDEENAFSDADVRLLETLANSMSVALENARLFDETNRLLKETEQRTAELAVINSVQGGLARELDMQAIYDMVGERIREIFDAQAVIIANLDLEQRAEIFRYTIENGERFFLEPRPFDKLRKHLVQTKQKVVINNSGEAFVWFGNKVLPGTKPMQSGAFVPLIIGDKITSYISLQNVDRENAFSDSDIRLLETLANSMSVALENARLFDETNRLLKETEQRTTELAVINSVQEGLVREMDIQAIYNLVGDRLCQLFPDTQTLVIRTFDHKSGKEHFQYAIEKGVRMNVEERPFIWANNLLIKTQQSLLINENYEELSKKYGGSGVTKGQPPKSAVFVPMIVGDIVKGSISLQNVDRENAFTESDLRLLTTLTNSMSVALENARLFDETTHLLKETEQRTAELAVINSVQEGLAKELDIQAIYDLVGKKIREVFDAQVVIIATLDQEARTEKIQYLIEKGERFYPEVRPFDKLREYLIDSKQKILINSNVEDAITQFGLTVVPGTELPKSVLFVPLVIGNKITSYVSLQNVDKENAFSDSDVRLMETLANSMSVALENARLFDETTRLLKETEQRTAELAVINSVQEGLARELDMQAIYDLVGNKIREVFNAQVVLIANLDHEQGIEHFKYHIEKDERSYPNSRPFDKLRQHLIQTRQKIVINEKFAEAFTRFGMKVIPGTEMPESALFVPLIKGDRVTSYVSLQNVDKENAFTDSDVRLLETLANSMSVALENARLFDETNRLLKETEQRTAELAVINSVQEGLARELDMQAIYDLVGTKIRDVFNAQTVIIANLDHDTHQEHFKYYIEKGERSYPQSRLFDKLRQQLVETRQKIVINEKFAEAFTAFGLKVIPGTEMPESAVFVPLIKGDKVTSYVSLQNVDTENAFSESDVRLLETLANSMSVALENARLFDETTRLLKETEQRTAELAVINSVQDGLVREMDINAIYELVGKRLCDLFNTQTVLIRTFDHQNQLEHWRYVIEKGERHYSDPRPLIWANRHMIENRKPIIINENYLETSKKYGGSGVSMGLPPKSGVFVPMIVGDVVRGSVSLQNVEMENAFSESDLRLLTTITNSMSVALENARLFDETTHLLKETEQHKAELAVINSVQEGLVREMDMRAIYELVGNRICELFDTQTVLIRTFDHKSGNEEWVFAIEKGERLFSKPRPFNWANQLLIQTKQPLLIPENYLETAKQHGGSGVTKGLPPKSAVFVPMIVGDVVRGSVSLQNVEKEHAFSEADMRLLTTLTNSMSVALENARLFDETTHLLAEAKQRATELTTVNSISKALASQLDPHELIKLVGDQLRDLFKANIVYLALLDQKSNTIFFPYQYGDNMAPMQLGEGLTSKIILNGQPLLVNKDVNEIRQQLGVQQIGIPAASYLGVPIPVGDEIIGVLSVQSTEQENRFNESDQRLLSTIAASVGVALRNAKLFEEVQQSKMEAEAASKVAEKANEAKSAFLSTVSHELRTPLTSVLGFAKIIRKRLDEKIFPVVDKSDSKTAKTISQINENLQVVISEGERLTHLINDVLDLAKIEAGKMEWNFEKVYLPEVVERAIAATTSLFDQKPIHLIRDIEQNVPPISGDPDKLIQVIINLISNAVKFTDQGDVRCRLHYEGDEMIVSISDTGIGIAPEDFGAVFEQFKQVGGDTLTDKPKGTGLGLPICKEIIEHHGGRIWLESEIGKGSTFSFALPIVQSTPVKVKPMHFDELVKQLKEQMAFSQLKANGTHATILVVDDDDSIRSLLQQELSEGGYQIEEATNGKEALEKVRQHKPDLIILDVMMPEMNGFDVAAILKNDPQTMDIPIIVLSIVQDKARGFRIGVDRYLTKPIDTTQLFMEVGNLLEQGKSRKKVMVVDEDTAAVKSLTDVLQTRGYQVVESDGTEMVEKAIATQPDIIILNSVMSANKQEIVQTLRFEKGLENVLFFIYQ